jgi:hypothetical protein
MDQATQQNAALVEEMAAAASSLRSQASELVQSVAAFRMSGHADASRGQPAEASTGQASPARAMSRPTTPATQSKLSAKPTTLAKPALRKPTPARPAISGPGQAKSERQTSTASSDANGDWESF